LTNIGKKLYALSRGADGVFVLWVPFTFPAKIIGCVLQLNDEPWIASLSNWSSRAAAALEGSNGAAASRLAVDPGVAACGS
jgi:hypothetical protein